MTTESAAPERPDRKVRGAEHRLLRGYAPAIALGLFFLIMVLSAPTVAPERIQVAGGGRTTTGGTAQATAGGPVDPVTGEPTPGVPGVGIPAAAACPGFQVDDDPYSPPCAQWDGGDNGGATARGVTATSIKVTMRDAGLPDLGSLIAQFSGVNDYVSNAAEAERTIRVMLDYFNDNYEFYGRRIELAPFKGQGNLIDEALGGGVSGAQADAIKVVQEIQGFASLSTVTQPYGDALATQGVIAFDNIFMTREWANKRAPYGFNTYADCSKAADVGAEFASKLLVGRPAEFAGPAYQGTERKFGIIVPDTATFKPCIDQLKTSLDAAGVGARVLTYSLDLGTIQNQGQQLASTLKADGVTTVFLLTDPATPFFFASGAQAIQWFPEWVVMGQPYLDFDYLAQIFPRQQWEHAIGFSFNGTVQPPRASDAYRAFKSQSPDTEPSMLILPAVYGELRMLALGVQLAGPNLTPETFAAGLRSYQSTLGPDGLWAFPEGDFSAPQDFRLIWFDGATSSPQNDRPGAYLDNGQRYERGQIPEGQRLLRVTGP
jgi:hypothetical protein